MLDPNKEYVRSDELTQLIEHLGYREVPYGQRGPNGERRFLQIDQDEEFPESITLADQSWGADGSLWYELSIVQDLLKSLLGVDTSKIDLIIKFIKNKT